MKNIKNSKKQRGFSILLLIIILTITGLSTSFYIKYNNAVEIIKRDNEYATKIVDSIEQIANATFNYFRDQGDFPGQGTRFSCSVALDVLQRTPGPTDFYLADFNRLSPYFTNYNTGCTHPLSSLGELFYINVAVITEENSNRIIGLLKSRLPNLKIHTNTAANPVDPSSTLRVPPDMILVSLSDDTLYSQLVAINGSRTMTGNLKLGGNDIENIRNLNAQNAGLAGNLSTGGNLSVRANSSFAGNSIFNNKATFRYANFNGSTNFNDEVIARTTIRSDRQANFNSDATIRRNSWVFGNANFKDARARRNLSANNISSNNINSEVLSANSIKIKGVEFSEYLPKLERAGSALHLDGISSLNLNTTPIPACGNQYGTPGRREVEMVYQGSRNLWWAGQNSQWVDLRIYTHVWNLINDLGVGSFFHPALLRQQAPNTLFSVNVNSGIIAPLAPTSYANYYVNIYCRY